MRSPIAVALEAPMVGDLMCVAARHVRPSWGDVVLRVLAVASSTEGMGTHDNVGRGMALVTW
jgi:hypothetical protein